MLSPSIKLRIAPLGPKTRSIPCHARAYQPQSSRLASILARRQLPDILGRCTDVISPRMMRILEELVGDWRRHDERIDAVSGEIQALAHSDADCQHLIERSRRQSHYRHRHGGGHRQRSSFHQRTEFRRLARLGAETNVDRRQNNSWAYYEAWQQLSALTLRPCRPVRTQASGELAQAWLRPLACASGPTTAPQCSRHGIGQQTGPYRLDRAGGKSLLRRSHCNEPMTDARSGSPVA